MLGTLRLQLEAPEIGFFEDPRNPKFEEPNYHAVYVITAHGSPCKIGIASDLERRLSTLQVSSPDKLSAAFAIWFQTMGSARRIERAAHVRLKEKRLRGEWFAVGPDEAIDAIANCIADAKLPYVAHADLIEHRRLVFEARHRAIKENDARLSRWVKARPDKVIHDGEFVIYRRDDIRIVESAS